MNRLKDEPKKEWITPKADANAGRQEPHYTIPTVHKRRRVDPDPDNQSPINLEDDSYDRLNRSVSARSGHTPTFNGSVKNGTGGLGNRIGEWQTLRNTTNPGGGSRRQKRISGSKIPPFKPLTVSVFKHHELPDDRIEDSDMEISRLPQNSQKRSNLAVELPDGGSKQLSTNGARRTNPQNDQMSSPDLEAFTTSQHLMNSNSSNIVKPARGHHTTKAMSTAQASHTSSQAVRGLRGQTTTEQEDDDSEDELATSELTGADAETSPQEIASKLLEERKSNQGRPQSRQEFSVALDDSDSDAVPSNADIVPTNFQTSSRKQAKSGTKNSSYRVRQIFDAQKVWLRDTDNEVLSLEHHEKHLEIPVKGKLNGQPILINQFAGIEYHPESCKVIVQRNRSHQGPSTSTRLHIEFISVEQRENFIENMAKGPKIPVKTSRAYVFPAPCLFMS